jgi:hypothetical protein
LQALDEQEAGVPGLKTYEVAVNGVKTSLRLSDADAKSRGLFKKPPAKPAATKPAAEPGPKAPAHGPDVKEAVAPLNKSRTTANK